MHACMATYVQLCHWTAFQIWHRTFVYFHPPIYVHNYETNTQAVNFYVGTWHLQYSWLFKIKGTQIYHYVHVYIPEASPTLAIRLTSSCLYVSTYVRMQHCFVWYTDQVEHRYHASISALHYCTHVQLTITSEELHYAAASSRRLAPNDAPVPTLVHNWLMADWCCTTKQ